MFEFLLNAIGIIAGLLVGFGVKRLNKEESFKANMQGYTLAITGGVLLYFCLLGALYV